jgi:hypothetical protein
MSKEALAKVVQRAISDASFRRQLSSDTAGALRGFDLTPDEMSALRAGDAGRLSTLGVDQRMSKSFALGGMAAATRMAQSDLTAGSATAFDDGTGAGGRTVTPADPAIDASADATGSEAIRAKLPSDPDRVVSADIDSGAGGTRTVRIGDDYKFAGRQAPEAAGHAGVAPVEGSPEATAAELGRSASDAGFDGAARLARLDERLVSEGSPAVDASGGSAPTTAFIDESEGYLTSVGYDPNVATSAVTDAHDRGGGAEVTAVTDAHDRGDVTRIADDADGGATSAGSEGGPNLSS